MMKPPLIVHVIHRLDVGGLENGLVNLINGMPDGRYRHAIICLEEYTDFRSRIKKNDVRVFALHKREGYDLRLYLKLFKLLRQLKPDIVHTRNLAALEAQPVAAAAGIKRRVHGEHGRDMSDLEGKNLKYNLLRSTIYPFVDQFITVSKDLQKWLVNRLKVSPERITQIYNGVDSERFSATLSQTIEHSPEGFFAENAFVIGSVGRMEAVKDYPTLIRAFIRLLEAIPDARESLRLMIVGGGSSRSGCLEMVCKSGYEKLIWMPGERSDIPDLMQKMDLFVLPSLGEGISNTILEAMSCSLPVVATRVGGNVELIDESQSGVLVEPGDEVALEEAILKYYVRPELLEKHGKFARNKIETYFSMSAMIENYMNVYDRLLNQR
ncbi:MAG: TIGR03088 family PEP-CTERM/XrtA system glycosyltransferase [Nitrosomonas sp.]|nr:TIGR03088 family PEP-CTERM/XrtA system glycosyltransferase [Nitrosomonas sp.]